MSTIGSQGGRYVIGILLGNGQVTVRSEEKMEFETGASAYSICLLKYEARS